MGNYNRVILENPSVYSEKLTFIVFQWDTFSESYVNQKLWNISCFQLNEKFWSKYYKERFYQFFIKFLIFCFKRDFTYINWTISKILSYSAPCVPNIISSRPGWVWRGSPEFWIFALPLLKISLCLIPCKQYQNI